VKPNPFKRLKFAVTAIAKQINLPGKFIVVKIQDDIRELRYTTGNHLPKALAHSRSDHGFFLGKKYMFDDLTYPHGNKISKERLEALVWNCYEASVIAACPETQETKPAIRNFIAVPVTTPEKYP